jgi:hypothetical protein
MVSFLKRHAEQTRASHYGNYESYGGQKRKKDEMKTSISVLGRGDLSPSSLTTTTIRQTVVRHIAFTNIAVIIAKIPSTIGIKFPLNHTNIT